MKNKHNCQYQTMIFTVHTKAFSALTLADVFRCDWIPVGDSLVIAFGVLVFSLTFDLSCRGPDGT